MEIGNELNNFFVNVGKHIEYNFDKNCFEKKPWIWLNKKGIIHDNIFLTPITQAEIIKYVSLIKHNNSFYDCGITNAVLKNTINNIIFPI